MPPHPIRFPAAETVSQASNAISMASRFKHLQTKTSVR
jgi:hypothetical protein